MTPEQVATQLGLRPWDQFALDVIREQLEWPRPPGEVVSIIRSGRGSGKTTRMLCNALAVVSEGKRVYIAGHDSRYTMELWRQARAYANELGLDARLIDREPRGVAFGQRFYDHYKGGRRW